MLRAADGIGLTEKLEDTFVELSTAIGRPQLNRGYACILRKVEVARRGLNDPVSCLFRANNLSARTAMASSTAG